MTGIEAIGVHVPDAGIDNVARAADFGRDPAFVREKLGFERLGRMSPGTDTADLCAAAFADLRAGRRFDLGEVDCLVVCTQNPDGSGLPHTSAKLQDRLGIGRRAACFDISLGCSGYVYGLSVVRSFLDAHGMRRGLLFTCDPYSKILDPADQNTELLFGDAATCTLLGPAPVYRQLATLFATDGAQQAAIMAAGSPPRLSMDGHAVFNFVLKTVPAQIRECLEVNGLTPGEVGLYLVHQASRYLVENLARRLGLEQDRVPFLARDWGNTVSSTLPQMLREVLACGPERILLSGFGVGLSWASTVIEKAGP